MGIQWDARVESGHRRPAMALAIGVCTVAAISSCALAASDIDAGSTYLASNLGSSVNAKFNGGTLELDASKTISRDFTVQDVATNTIDIHGSTVEMSGAFTGAGPLTILDGVGGGVLTFSSSSNTYSGATTVNSGATLALSDTGTIAASSKLTVNGTFDISDTTRGASIISLAGSGSVVLGAQSLAFSNAADTFSGVISGTGGLTITAGTETLTANSTYTGATTISTGTLVLSGAGSIAASGSVNVYSTLDITDHGATLKSLSGSGTVSLGTQTLTLTSAGGTFSGAITGTGGVVLNAGTEYLTGSNTFTGPVTVNGGTLELGSSTIAYNIANASTVAFYSTGVVSMGGVISGSGTVSNIGAGITTITSAQTYTGPTVISLGTIKLSGSGNIAASSSVTTNGTFDIAAISGTSITSLSGSGIVSLGTSTLTLTNSSGAFSGQILGTGNLILGGGTQTLSGASLYTGTTTIAAGTLALQAGGSLKSTVVDYTTLDISTGTATTGTATIGSLTGPGAVYLGANTLVLSNATDTFTGTLSGQGGLWINAGSETLSGTNTYTGTTTVASGTLVLSSTGSLDPTSKLAISGIFDASAASGSALTFASLSGSGTVTLGSHTLTLSDASGAFSGVIQGTSGLVVSGGTEILAGTNTYTGGTTITGGATLQLGSGITSGSIVGDVVDNGTLAFKRSDTIVFSGVISGGGAVSQTGAGTVVLAADNTYTGGTTISSGTLQIGNGGTAGSILGNVTDNGTLAFARSDATTITAVISGTGNLSFISGITMLTAAQSYVGATTINSGATLALGGSGNLASSRGVMANGTFDVSAASAPAVTSLSGSGTVALGSQTLSLTSASTTFSGAITGSGGIALMSGTQSLTGTSSYTGLTTINGGRLAVTGSIGSSQGVIVNSGGTLSGTGTVSAITVNSGGTIRPGAGTLAVQGNASFSADSTYVVTTTSSSSSTLSATGSASLAGTLSVASNDGTYRLGQKLTVLTATGGISGGFSLAQVSSTGAVFASALSYDANNVYLQIDLSRLSPLLPSGASANQKAVVGGIDAAIAAGSKLSQNIENLGNDTSAQLSVHADQLSGEIGADAPLAARSLFVPFLDGVFDHINSEQPHDTGVWGSLFGGSSVSAANTGSGAHRFKSTLTGVIAGANWMPWSGMMLGGAVSAGTADFSISGDLGTGHATALQASLYGHLQVSPHFYNSFAVAAALADIKTERVLTVSGNDQLNGKLTATMLGARYEAGVSLPWATPYIAAQEVFTSVPGYSESAASGSDAFALHYASRTLNDALVEMGLSQEIDVAVTPRWILTPDWTMHLMAKLAWAHDFDNGSNASAQFQSLPSSGFTVTGAERGTDFALVSAGADFRFDNGLRITSRVDSAFSSKSQSFTGYAGLGYRW